MSELYSFRWLRGKKESIINGDNTFQKALDNALNYQSIETDQEKISKLRRILVNIVWKGKNFQWC